jgi:hypothetical protein
MNAEAQLFNIIKAPAELIRFMPIRVILRKGEDGTLHGLCEESFSMSTQPTKIRIWWSGKAYSILGEHHINGIEDANYNAKPGDLIIDPLAEDCPIEIDWDRWLSAKDKFNQRNASFKLKEKQNAI